LTFEADHFVAHFHSDPSTAYWGVRVIVQGMLEDFTDGGECPRQRLELHKLKVDVACWVLEALLSSDGSTSATVHDSEVSRLPATLIWPLLCEPSAVSVLKECLEILPGQRKMKVANLVTAMMHQAILACPCSTSENTSE
ncbi:unnamed protein product, partial [Chrysoparadoxa australica]